MIRVKNGDMCIQMYVHVIVLVDHGPQLSSTYKLSYYGFGCNKFAVHSESTPLTEVVYPIGRDAFNAAQ